MNIEERLRRDQAQLQLDFPEDTFSAFELRLRM